MQHRTNPIVGLQQFGWAVRLVSDGVSYRTELNACVSHGNRSSVGNFGAGVHRDPMSPPPLPPEGCDREAIDAPRNLNCSFGTEERHRRTMIAFNQSRSGAVLFRIGTIHISMKTTNGRGFQRNPRPFTCVV